MLARIVSALSWLGKIKHGENMMWQALHAKMKKKPFYKIDHLQFEQQHKTYLAHMNKMALILAISLMAVILLVCVYIFDMRSNKVMMIDEDYEQPLHMDQTQWYQTKTNAVARDPVKIKENSVDDVNNLPTEDDSESLNETVPDLMVVKPYQSKIAQSIEKQQVSDKSAREQQAMNSALSLSANKDEQHTRSVERKLFSDPAKGVNEARANQLPISSIKQDFDESDQNKQRDKNAFLENNKIKSSNLPNDRMHPKLNSPYVITAGSIIPAVLIAGINSDLPGLALAQVRLPVYDSATGQHLLIPQGAKLLLQYDSQISFGQKRILIAVRKIIFPNGNVLPIEDAVVGDVSGYSGFADKIDNHYGKLYGSAALLGVISAGLQISQPQSESILTPASSGQVAAGAVSQQLGEVSSQVISKNLNVQPTLSIRPGYLFNITVTSDIVILSSYDNKRSFE